MNVLGIHAFGICSSLSKVVLVSGLTVLGGYMFDMWFFGTVPSLLTSITIPSTITTMGKLNE